MAINTYSTLQTAVANWLDRDDLTARIPEFIALAETRINRALRIRAMETVSTAISTASGTREYALPTKYVQMKTFALTTDPITSLAYITPEIMNRIWAGSTKGKPTAYTIVGDNVRLGPNPDAVYTTSMTYYKTFDALSDAAPTNWLMLNAADLLLYGSLLEAEPYLMNNEQVSLWATAFTKSLEDIQLQDNKDRHSGSELRVMNTGGYP